jgi:PIN domain nuclease of toxin-antitoxin system
MILLDTHAWIWWASGTKGLSRGAARRIVAASGLGVSVISVWEVAMLVAKGRLGLDRDVAVWIEQALALPRVCLVPLSPAVAIASTRLPGEFHGDPADRMLVATSLAEGCPLVTRDERIRAYPHVRTVW